MAVSVEQAESIVAAGKAAGKKLMVGYMKRYDAGNELVRSKVDEFRETGELGRTDLRAESRFLRGMDLQPRYTDGDERCAETGRTRTNA